MSTGRVHALVTTTTAPAVGVAVYAYTGEGSLAFWASAGCLLGIFLTPDLDIDGVTLGEWWIIRATFGLGFAWLAIWGPYAMLIRHRSPLSHWPILSTGLRLIYLYVALWLLDQLNCFSFSLPSMQVLWQSTTIRVMIVGLVASDIGHWIFDWRVLSRRFGSM